MNGQGPSIAQEFDQQAAPVAGVAVENATRNVYLVYSERATKSNEYYHVATVQLPNGKFENIPYTKLYHDHNWNGWEERCVWKDATHIATVDESRVVSYTSTHGMSADKMPAPGNVSLMFRPK